MYINGNEILCNHEVSYKVNEKDMSDFLRPILKAWLSAVTDISCKLSLISQQRKRKKLCSSEQLPKSSTFVHILPLAKHRSCHSEEFMQMGLSPPEINHSFCDQCCYEPSSSLAAGCPGHDPCQPACCSRFGFASASLGAAEVLPADGQTLLMVLEPALCLHRSEISRLQIDLYRPQTAAAHNCSSSCCWSGLQLARMRILKSHKDTIKLENTVQCAFVSFKDEETR